MRQMQRQVPGQPGIWNGSGRTWAWGGGVQMGEVGSRVGVGWGLRLGK